LKYFIIFITLLLFIACKNGSTEQKVEKKGLFSLFTEDTTKQVFFFSKKEGVFADSGMVASANVIASKIGIEILKKGGNAVDAAVAVHFALAVVYPFAGNIGGGGFAIIREPNGSTYSLDFREKAPLLATEKMYLNANDEVIENLSTKGHLSVGVPGSVMGLEQMHLKMGQLPWATLLDPAITLAENGFILSGLDALSLNNNLSVFNEINGEANNTFLPKNSTWAENDTLVQPLLAKTLKPIAKFGSKDFYEGETAKLLVAEIQKGKGIISFKDLQKYQAVWRKPIKGSYKGYNIFSMPLPSSGGIALMQLLLTVEPYDLQKFNWHSDSAVQLIIEAERRVYADRATWMGDADFVNVPIDTLIDKKYLAKRFMDFSWDKASKSENIKAGKVVGYESDETTHFSIVDKNRMAVSLTTTLNGAFGSKVIVEGAGFLLNNEMDDFSVKAGSPNMFGLVGNKANAIEPEKRMLSSMTPTIVEKEGELFMVLGTPGGSTIITSVFQTLINVLDFKMGMQQAVNAHKFHHQWLPDKVFYEKNAFTAAQVDKLAKKGFILEELENTLGRMDCILIHPNGLLEGASDARANNTSVGY